MFSAVTMFSLLNTLALLCDIYTTTNVTSEKLRETYDQIIETLQSTFSDNIIDFEYYSVALQTIKEVSTRDLFIIDGAYDLLELIRSSVK